MNTIANWSEPGVYSLRKTPYTVTLGIDGPRLQGSGGYWGKFGDVFDPQFAAAAQRAAARVARPPMILAPGIFRR